MVTICTTGVPVFLVKYVYVSLKSTLITAITVFLIYIYCILDLYIYIYIFVSTKKRAQLVQVYMVQCKCTFITQTLIYGLI